MNNNENNQPVQEPIATAAAAANAQPAPAAKKFDLSKLGDNKIVLLIPICIIGFIVLILLFLAISTRTLKCKTENEIGDVVTKTVTKEKFRFGKPISVYVKSVSDFSDADLSKKELKEKTKDVKKQYKAYCKKKDGCKYTVKQSGKKITVVIKQKYDADDRDDWEDAHDSFKEYKEEFYDRCDD